MKSVFLFFICTQFSVLALAQSCFKVSCTSNRTASDGALSIFELEGRPAGKISLFTKYVKMTTSEVVQSKQTLNINACGFFPNDLRVFKCLVVNPESTGPENDWASIESSSKIDRGGIYNIKWLSKAGAEQQLEYRVDECSVQNIRCVEN